MQTSLYYKKHYIDYLNRLTHSSLFSVVIIEGKHTWLNNSLSLASIPLTSPCPLPSSQCLLLFKSYYFLELLKLMTPDGEHRMSFLMV